MLTNKEDLIKRLAKVEKELEKVRGCSVLIDGWQTQRFAKKDRKWDYYAVERMKLINTIDDLENCKRDKHNDDIFNHGNCLDCGLNIKKIKL